MVSRSLRGRPSQVKGASGVADAMPLRGTLDLRASTTPPGSVTGRPQAPPSTTRDTTAATHAHNTTAKGLPATTPASLRPVLEPNAQPTTPKSSKEPTKPKINNPEPLDTAPRLQG